MPVRRASIKKSLINNAPELTSNPSYTQALGMLLLGEDSCRFNSNEVLDESNEYHSSDRKRSETKQNTKETKQSTKESKKNKKSQKPGLFEKFGDVFGNMFSDDDE